MKPASIKVLMTFDDAVPIIQAEGVELRIDPSRVPETIDVDSALKQIAAALRTYVSKE